MPEFTGNNHALLDQPAELGVLGQDIAARFTEILPALRVSTLSVDTFEQVDNDWYGFRTFRSGIPFSLSPVVINSMQYARGMNIDRFVVECIDQIDHRDPDIADRCGNILMDLKRMNEISVELFDEEVIGKRMYGEGSEDLREKMRGSIVTSMLLYELDMSTFFRILDTDDFFIAPQMLQDRNYNYRFTGSPTGISLDASTWRGPLLPPHYDASAITFIIWQSGNGLTIHPGTERQIDAPSDSVVALTGRQLEDYCSQNGLYGVDGKPIVATVHDSIAVPESAKADQNSPIIRKIVKTHFGFSTAELSKLGYKFEQDFTFNWTGVFEDVK